MARTVELCIRGVSLRLQTDQSAESLEALLGRLEDTLDVLARAKPKAGTDELLLMAALNFLGELMDLEGIEAGRRKELEGLLATLREARIQPQPA